VQTLIYSLPALGNVGTLMVLFFFIYGIMAMNLFGQVKYTEGSPYLSAHANFSTFPLALLTLFRMITGENWNGILQVRRCWGRSLSKTTDAGAGFRCLVAAMVCGASLPVPSPHTDTPSPTHPTRQSCMVTSECILITQSLPSSNLTAGTYLDLGDPRLAALPPWAQHNQCSISPLLAVLFFSSFTVLCTMFTTSLVVGVIIDNFEMTFNDDVKKVRGGMAFRGHC
jgi:hypothetical protein